MVKEGYKETELGLIPEDWDTIELIDLCTPKARIGWQNLRKDEYLPYGEFLLITGTDFSEGKILYKSCFYVSKNRYEQDKNIQVKNGDILITKDGTLGKVAMLENLHQKATLNAGVFVLTNLSKRIDNHYLYQYLRTDFLLDYASKHSTGGTIKHLNQNILVHFSVMAPPLFEQHHIAEALSDMDSLISSLEKLIEKKKAIKQACLQKMFPKDGENVPEMRLPGFTEPWEQRKLGDCVTFLDTMRKPLKESERETGDYPYYGASGIVDYVSDYIFDEELVLLSEDGANITDRNYPVCFLASGKYWVNNHAHVLKVNAENENNFICNSLERMDFTQYNSGMAMPKLNKDVCHNILLFCPVYEEQRQIGDYFRNLDHLITLHQRKLEKCKKIKQGMMQQLLTGKIRLTDSFDNHTEVENKKTVLTKQPSKHNQKFDDAVVIAAVVDKFYSDKYPLGRKKIQKLLYLLRRHQEADVSAFKKKAAGPYADDVRYKGGEGIAIKNKYIVVQTGKKGSKFKKGEKISNALGYVDKWNLTSDLQWLLQFKYTTVDDLELYATVDMAICDLKKEGKEPSLQNIKMLIKSNKEWEAKLSKPYFTDKKIGDAIKRCNLLFG